MRFKNATVPVYRTVSTNFFVQVCMHNFTVAVIEAYNLLSFAKGNYSGSRLTMGTPIKAQQRSIFCHLILLTILEFFFLVACLIVRWVLIFVG